MYSSNGFAIMLKEKNKTFSYIQFDFFLSILNKYEEKKNDCKLNEVSFRFSEGMTLDLFFLRELDPDPFDHNPDPQPW